MNFIRDIINGAFIALFFWVGIIILIGMWIFIEPYLSIVFLVIGVVILVKVGRRFLRR